MSEKLSLFEPAKERPITIALSEAEIHVLIKHHVGMTKKVANYIGKSLCKLGDVLSFATRSEKNALIAEGQRIVDAHLARAKGLQSLLKK